MKVNLIEKEESRFKPFKFEVTIESEDELKELYHRLNASDDSIEKGSDEKECPFPKEWNADYLLFNFISNKLEEAKNDQT